MWLLILLFGLATLILGWTIFAYFLLLWFVGLFRRAEPPAWPDDWPRLSVVIPFRNERHYLPDKLANTRALDYPADRLEVIFVDGGSTDEGLEWIQAAVADDPRYRALAAPRPGKVPQLNHALELLTGEIVVSTDADARLDPDALRWIAAEMAAAPEVVVVGAYCRPLPHAYHIDRYYWDAQNRARFVESQAAGASIVVAPCYAYRRSLLAAFPNDVVADDLYVAFLASALGLRTIYSRHARAVELRNPADLGEFLPHKYRKSNAFLRESLRFVYRLPDMAPLVRLVFMTRIAQQLIFPWALAWWLGLAGALVTLQPLARYDVVAISTGVLFLLFLLVSRAYRTVELPATDGSRYGLNTIVRGWILTTLVLLVTGVSYPFYRQDSSYARVGGPPLPGPGSAPASPDRSAESVGSARR